MGTGKISTTRELTRQTQPSHEKQVRTLADLAEIAGVSAGTVSRALAGKTLVNYETRKRIQDLAQQHGFRPNQMASKLRTQRTGVIGVVIPLGHDKRQAISDPFLLTLLGHLADELTDIGYDLMLSRIIPDGTSEWLARLTASGMVDGVLIIGQSNQYDIIENIAENYHPLVAWGHHSEGQIHCVVGTDNMLGGALAVEHLLAAGAKSLAFLGDTTSITIAKRYEGALEAAQKAGIELAQIPINLASSVMSEQIEALIHSPDFAFDGLICSTDLMAMSAMRALNQVGLSVPDSVQVTGFGNLPVSEHTTPTMTTIRQDIAEGARLMVQCLHDRLQGKDTDSIVMSPTLVVRNSTKPVPA